MTHSATDCPRFGKFFGGCKFLPRYDISPTGANPSVAQIKALSEAILFSDDTVRAIEAMASEGSTYVRDVCERCGRTIERMGGINERDD